MKKSRYSDHGYSQTSRGWQPKYSTFDWVLHGLIERAGFSVEHMNTEDVLESEYICRKVQSF